MPGDKVIAGRRVHLRRLAAPDLDERVLAWHRDPELMRFYSGTRREYSRAFLVDQLEQGEKSGTLFVYGIYTNDDDRLVGTVKIGPIEPHHGHADLSTLIGERECRGRGLAAEAVRLGSRIAFERHGVRKLTTGMYEQNEASIRAYARAGWVGEGRLRGHYLVEGEPADRVLMSCFPHDLRDDDPRDADGDADGDGDDPAARSAEPARAAPGTPAE